MDGNDLLMGSGPLLATLIRAPWQLYLTLGTRAGERVRLEAASCEARRADTGTVRLSPVEARGSIAISRRDQPISGMVTAIFATRLLRVLRSL